MSTESELKRYRDQAVRLRGDISRYSSTVATKRKKAADAQASASRSKSSSTIRSKLREAETATREANSAESKRADAERKVAAAEKKIAELQTKYEKEQRVQTERSLTAIRKASTTSNVSGDVYRERHVKQPSTSTRQPGTCRSWSRPAHGPKSCSSSCSTGMASHP